MKTLVGHTNFIASITYSPDGTTLAGGSWNGPIHLWNVQTGQRLKTLLGHAEGVPSLSYSVDGTTLASGNWDNTIRLWQVETGQLLRTLTGMVPETDSNYIKSTSLSPDGQTLAVATDEENVIRLLDTHTGKVNATLTGHTRSVTFVAFSSNRSVLLWDLTQIQTNAD